MFFKKIVRKLKLKFYETNRELPKVLSYYNFFGSSMVLLSIILNFGFRNILFEQQNLLVFIVSFFYLTSYIIRATVYVNFWEFFKKHKALSFIILLTTIELLNTIFSISLIEKDSNSRILILLLIQFYFFFQSLGSILKQSAYLKQKTISPSILLIISFLSLIIIGTFLLMMPDMTNAAQSIGLKNALFTSISASSVTGLTILETTSFSIKGQFIIMLLIQLGGINIIAFATFFALFSRTGIGIQQQKMISENFNTQNLLSGKSLLIQVFIFSIIIEAIGTIIILANYSFDYEKIFESIFHSISAFNNAGFVISEDFHNSVHLKLCITILIFLGAIGFPTLSDLLSKISMKKTWKQLHLTTKISLISSLLLIIFGACSFLLLELNNQNLETHSWFQKTIDSIFHSVSARTAGFSSIQFNNIGVPTLMIFMFLMFIGASPGSTGGGIKTNTFVLLTYSTIATIRGKKNIEISNRRISSSLLHKSFSIFLFGLLTICLGWFILLITEPEIDPIYLLFEQTSAFSTVGLSTGETTKELSTIGTFIIMITMFIGRIGTLLMAFSLIQKKKKPNYQYPEAHLMVG